MKFLFSLLILLSVDSAWSQRIDPAPQIKFPTKKTKKLKRKKGDGWQVPGYELSYSNTFFGLATSQNGEFVYLHRYPETDTLRGVVTLDSTQLLPVADGPATFLNPRREFYQSGSFRQNKPHGTWISVSLRYLQGSCPELTLATKPAQVADLLRTCYPDASDQAQIILQTASYLDGKLEGPAVQSTLAGEIKQTLNYKNGRPVGKPVKVSFWGTPSLTALDNEKGIDTPYSGAKTEIDSVALLKFSERMPAFKSPDCNPQFLDTLMRGPYDEYLGCGTKAMLAFLYSNIEYPKSSRKLRIEGANVTSFIIEKDGSISDIRTVRHVSGPLDAESRRLVSEMPLWAPGFRGGQRIRARCKVAIQYRLEE